MSSELETAYRIIGAQIMDNAAWQWRVFCDNMLLFKLVEMTGDWVSYLESEEDTFQSWGEWEWWDCTSEEWYEDEPDDMDDPCWGEGGVYLDESYRE